MKVLFADVPEFHQKIKWENAISLFCVRGISYEHKSEMIFWVLQDGTLFTLLPSEKKRIIPILKGYFPEMFI